LKLNEACSPDNYHLSFDVHRKENPVKITDSLRGDVVVIALSGKIMGGDDATLFHGRLHEYLNRKRKNIVVDLAKVSWTNSQGLGMLVSALTAVKRENGRIVLANITNIRGLLAMTKLITVFECYDSLEEAIASLESQSAKH
jgi:anti-sigma B factor antagonist